MTTLACLEQSIMFLEGLLLECTICLDKEGCKRRVRIKHRLGQAKAELNWEETVGETEDKR